MGPVKSDQRILLEQTISNGMCSFKGAPRPTIGVPQDRVQAHRAPASDRSTRIRTTTTTLGPEGRVSRGRGGALLSRVAQAATYKLEHRKRQTGNNILHSSPFGLPAT